MRIYFYPECNFNINKAKTYDVTSLAEWFDSQHKNPDDYEIVGRDGESHDSAYEADVCAVYPRIMGGKSKGKNILKAVIGLGLLLATGGTTAALFAHYGGINMAHALGAGLLLSGGGALLMGKMKMPSMDLSSDSATKENYQWNVGNLSTSRGVKGVTFGSDVIPEGELLAYRTYGTNNLKSIVDKAAGWYWNGDYNSAYSATKPKTGAYRYYQYKQAKTHNEISDSASYLEMLIGCGEGELDSITDIRINDISLSDLGMVENVDYAIRLGSNTQTALKQTDLDSQAGYSSIGQTVPVKLNGSVTPLLITTPSACDSCCIAFQTPNWYLYDTSSGAKNNAYIKLKIGYRTNGSTGSYTYVTTGVKEIDNAYPLKTESAFYFQVVIKFPSNGTYQICIENDSAELNNTKGLLTNAEYSGSALPDRAAINISVDNIACYNNKEQTYPNTALIWLRIPASQTLNGSMPKVTWKQTRASIYAYNGSSYVAKPADNLAWAIYDIIAQVRKDGNTYHNEGEDVANIDFDKFVAFATFCDSIGAKGNWFLNKLDTSWSNAMSVATSCRAFIGLRSGKVCPYWDAPTEMTQIFTVGNYEDMSGVITAKKDRAKAIEATFNNEEEKYASRTVRVEIDNDHSAEAVSMTFVGLSNPVNVSKQAHYILRRNKYLVQSVKFTADIDSIVCELNDVIGIQCDLTEYGVGGRIFKVENNVISLDAPVTLTSGNSYALLVRHTDGTLERKTPVETNGTFTQLTFNSAWSKPVLKGDVYSFGIANSEVRKYRVTGITRTNDLKAQIEAIEYNENVYDELAVAPYTYTNPNAGINNVTTTYTPEAVELAWDANNNTSYVNVYVDGVFYGRYQNGAQIPNINSEQLIEMFPVNEYGEEDTPVVRTISNNLPTPSTPPVPIVQSTTTGCVAEFDGIPKNENIVWLIIKEGDNELGRVNILGEYMSVSIQLRSGTHALSAYFVNQFSKSSQARTFTATPLGDIQANDISATALKLPTGSILRLSAKNCTTESIAQTVDAAGNPVYGVKDVSGNGNHGRAFGGVTVVQDSEMGDCFSFPSTGSGYLRIDNTNLINKIKSLTKITISLSFRTQSSTSRYCLFCLINESSLSSGVLFVLANGKLRFSVSSAGTVNSLHDYNDNKKHSVSLVLDFDNNNVKLYVDGVFEAEKDDSSFVQLLTLSYLRFGYGGFSNYAMVGNISDVRIYPRALTASEIKTIFMFPDDVTFGQMTADLIGANIIKGTNLYSENIITQAAQINQAVFQSLIVTNGSTVANQVSVGGRNLALSSENQRTMSGQNAWLYNLSQYGKDHVVNAGKITISADVKCTEANRTITLYLRSSSGSTTVVTNADVYPSTTEFTRVKATFDAPVVDTSIYAVVRSYDSSTNTTYVKNVMCEIGNKATDWTPAPEDVDSDINTVQSNLDTVTTNIYSPNTTTINGGKITTGSITTGAISAGAITAEKLSVEAIKKPSDCVLEFSPKGYLGNSFAVGDIVSDLSGGGRAMKLVNATGLSISRWQISDYCFFFPSGGRSSLVTEKRLSLSLPYTMRVKFQVFKNYPSDTLNGIFGNAWGGENNTTQQGCNIGIQKSTGYLDITTNNGDHIINLGFQENQVVDVVVIVTSSGANYYVDGVYKGIVSFANYGAGNYLFSLNRQLVSSSSYCANCPILIAQVYNRALSDKEIMTLYKLGTDTEAGQITADRIAAGSVETRHLTADAIVGKTFQTASNTGTNNAAGVRFNSSGIQGFNGSAKKFDLSTNGKLTCSDVDLTGKITASSGKIGLWSISDNILKGIFSEAQQSINILYDPLIYTKYTTNSGRIFEHKICPARIRLDDNNIGGNPMYAIIEAAVSEFHGPNTSTNVLIIQGKVTVNGSVVHGSDENIKSEIKDVSTLEKLKKIRVKSWKYDEEKIAQKEYAEQLGKYNKGEITEKPELKTRNTKSLNDVPLHIGAMAAEFNEAFGTSNNSKDYISYTDEIGVCMRAIQELAEIVDAQKAEIAELKAKLKIQQDKKLDVEQKEPTSKENLRVENDDTEPITEPVGNSEQLKDGGESEEKK